MTLPLATHGYLVDDCPSAILAVNGNAAVDALPVPPSGTAALDNPIPLSPIAQAIAFPPNPAPKPPSGMATLENPAPLPPQGSAVDQTPNPPPIAPSGGKAEDV